MLALGARLADNSLISSTVSNEQGDDADSDRALQSLFDLIETTRHSLDEHILARRKRLTRARTVDSDRSSRISAPDGQNDSEGLDERVIQEFKDCEDSVYSYFDSREAQLRSTYDESRGALERCVSKSSSLAEIVHSRCQALRLQERRLFAKRESLTKELRAANARQEKLRHSVMDVEAQRKAALDAIEHPSWEVPHHFHMTAVEHFRGNKQRQMADIAGLFPGHLRILAMAKCTAELPQKLIPALQMAQKERQKAAAAVKSSIEDHNRKKNEIEALQLRLVELQQRIGSEARRQMRAAHGKRKVYRAIKCRYFAALNLTHGDERMDEASVDNMDVPEDIEDSHAWYRRVDDAIEELEETRIRCKQNWDRLQKLISVKRKLEGELCVLRVRLEAPKLRSISKDTASSLSPSRTSSLRGPGLVSRRPSSIGSPRSDTPASSPSFFGSGSPVSPSIMALG